MPKTIAKKHSLDVPHHTSVEFPLNVKNPDRAISMIGGKDKLSKIIINQKNEKLELRLRNDPYHHPIVSSLNKNENILLKISVPKENLPEGFDPENYDLQQVLQHSHENGPSSIKCKFEPIAIINKNYSFKGMADFQYVTKNNGIRNTVVDSLYEGNLENIKKFNKSLDGLIEETTKSLENKNLGLPPPPIFSTIDIPFHYKYHKSPFTSEIVSANGQIKMVNTKERHKLHSTFLQYGDIVPSQPPQALFDRLKKIQETIEKDNSYDRNSFNFLLLECVRWLGQVFEYKPCWIRKQLIDILPDRFGTIIRFALPYVAYIYKKGPWRQCYVKFGVDPVHDKSSYLYQTEAFRLSGLHVETVFSSDKTLPPTLKDHKDNKDELSFELSSTLLFDGENLPSTLCFQLGDLLDPDCIKLLQSTEGKQLSEECDFNYGWMNPKALAKIRKVIRYKLRQILNEKEIDSLKIQSIIHGDIDIEKAKTDDGEEEDQDGDSAEEDEEEDGDGVHGEEFADNGEEMADPSLEAGNDIASILKRLRVANPEAADRIKNLAGLLKQDELEQVN